MKPAAKLTAKIYFDHLKKHKWLCLGMFGGVIGGAVFSVLPPYFFKQFFDVITQTGDRGEIADKLIGILIIVAGLEIMRWLFWRLSVFTYNILVPKIDNELAQKCFNYLHKHSYSFFTNSFVGSLVKQINWFGRGFEDNIDRINWTIMPGIIEIFVILLILGKRNLWLGVAMAIWIIFYLTINWFLSDYKAKYDKKHSNAESEYNALLSDSISNHLNVKLFNGYKRETLQFASLSTKVNNLFKKSLDLDSIFEAIQSGLTIVLEIGIFFIAIRLWRRNILSVGDLVLVQAYILTIINTVWGFARTIRQLFSSLARAEEMTVTLTTPYEIQDKMNASELSVKNGQIEFKEVCFNYNETRIIFKDLNLKIAPGEKVAFVGPSGSGKSTVTKLLLRLHDLSGGKILIDGQCIDVITQESLWQNISFVPQESILFHRSLLENIRYAKPNAADEEVIAAAKLAHCHEFINNFPEKYNTFVGERGVKLSGGERQRVAIARAILKNAPILILDEATSSLDSESENLIQDALNTLMQNKTVIVIAHRLSTIMKMDRIVVIKNGEVKEEGKHAELLQKPDGIYRHLWKLQAGGFIPDEENEVIGNVASFEEEE